MDHFTPEQVEALRDLAEAKIADDKHNRALRSTSTVLFQLMDRLAAKFDSDTVRRSAEWKVSREFRLVYFSFGVCVAGPTFAKKEVLKGGDFELLGLPAFVNHNIPGTEARLYINGEPFGAVSIPEGAYQWYLSSIGAPTEAVA